MTPQEFRTLLQKYKDGALSEAESALLQQALASPDFRDILEEDMKSLFESGAPHPSWDKTKEDLLWQKIRPAGLSTPVRWLRRSAAIAAAVLAIAVAVWLLIPEKEKPVPIPGAPANAGAPGANKATLLLAGGNSVILDDLHTGAVTTQGSTDIVKQDSGMLVYQPQSARGNDQLLYNTVITPRGGQYRLLLPDGTRVWLNAASSLRFPTRFANGERRVTLTGEAYFEVKHLDAQPFRIEAGNRLIEDLGTAFNINTYPDEPQTRTTLVEGSIKITGKKTTILRPGQQARWSVDSREIIDDKVDMEEVLAWKNGQIAFTNADFQGLMRQISRWYDVDIRYDGPVPAKHFFGMLSRNVSLPTIMEFLEHNQVHMRLEGRQLTLLP